MPANAASQRKETFGCKFDASGNYTECGAAVVNNKTGELDVVVAEAVIIDMCAPFS